MKRYTQNKCVLLILFLASCVSASVIGQHRTTVVHKKVVTSDFLSGINLQMKETTLQGTYTNSNEYHEVQTPFLFDSMVSSISFDAQHVTGSIHATDAEEMNKYSVGNPTADNRLEGPDKPDTTKLELFALSDVKLLDSPFLEAMDRDGKYLLDLNADRLLAPYLREAGLDAKAESYGGWESSGVVGEGLDGHSLGHYLSALSMVYASTGNRNYLDRLNYVVDELERAQNAIGTGYVGGVPNGQQIFEEVASGNIDAEPFGLNGGWVPWYNLHKTFAGLRDAYRHAGNEKALDVLIGLSDWAVNFSDKLSDQEFQTMLQTEHGGMKEVMADVYEITRDEKYLNLAGRFSHQIIFEPLANREDRLEGLHANTQIPKIIGAARHYEVSGNQQMGDIARFFWETVVNNRTYVNGGNSSHEHFGRIANLSDQLGRSTSESCNTYNMLKLTRHLTQWDANPAYADYYERALYNHILASQDPETGMFAYYIPLQGGFFKTFSKPYDAFWCCVGTGMENHTKYGRYIYMHSGSNLYVNLFIPSLLHWEQHGVEIRQETEFPQGNTSTFTIKTEQPKELALHIRRPGWANDGYRIRVNGEDMAVSNEAGSYIEISRIWQDGDRVNLSLPMELRVEPMPDDSNKVAFLYGPVLLAGVLQTEVPTPIPYADGNQRTFFDLPLMHVPEVKLTSENPNDFIKSKQGETLEFVLQDAGEASGIILKPFYKVNHSYYSVYWNVEGDSKSKGKSVP